MNLEEELDALLRKWAEDEEALGVDWTAITVTVNVAHTNYPGLSSMTYRMIRTVEPGGKK